MSNFIQEILAGLNEVELIQKKISPSDLKFISFAKLILTDEKTLKQKTLTTKVTLVCKEKEIYTNQGLNSNTLKFKEQTLKRLVGQEIILNPESTGAIKISFWRSKNQYFILAYGGCEVLEFSLFGPFSLPFPKPKLLTLDEVEKEMVLNKDYSKKIPHSNKLIFGISQITIKKDKIVTESYLKNTSVKKQESFFIPDNNKKPIHIKLEGEIKLKKKLSPVSPVPIRIIFPPQSWLKIKKDISLSDYNYTPGKTIELNWSLNYWAEERPHGRMKVKLLKP